MCRLGEVDRVRGPLSTGQSIPGKRNRIVISASRTDTAAQLCDRSTLWGLGAHRIPVHCKQLPFILPRARNDRVGLYCDQGCISSDLSPADTAEIEREPGFNNQTHSSALLSYDHTPFARPGLDR